MHSVIETEAFEKGAKEIGMSEDEVHHVKTSIASDPMAGVLVSGTGGVRKVRFPLNGKGKSGGCRVITYYAGEDIPVFLLDVFSKSVKINLTKSERNVLKRQLGCLAEEYREGVKRKMEKIGRAS